MLTNVKSELEKPLVKYGLLAVCLILIIQYLLVPWVEWRQAQVDELKLKSSLVVDKALLAATLNDLKAADAQLQTAIGELEQRFKGKVDRAKIELPTEVRKLCESLSLKVNRIAVIESEQIGSLIYPLVVSLEAEGTPNNIFRFLQQVESAKAFSIVDRITIYDAKSSNVRARMELYRYVDER